MSLGYTYACAHSPWVPMILTWEWDELIRPIPVMRTSRKGNRVRYEKQGSMARLREAPLMYVRRNGSKNSGDQLIQAQILSTPESPLSQNSLLTSLQIPIEDLRRWIQRQSKWGYTSLNSIHAYKNWRWEKSSTSLSWLTHSPPPGTFSLLLSSVAFSIFSARSSIGEWPWCPCLRGVQKVYAYSFIRSDTMTNKLVSSTFPFAPSFTRCQVYIQP